MSTFQQSPTKSKTYSEPRAFNIKQYLKVSSVIRTLNVSTKKKSKYTLMMTFCGSDRYTIPMKHLFVELQTYYYSSIRKYKLKEKHSFTSNQQLNKI